MCSCFSSLALSLVVGTSCMISLANAQSGPPPFSPEISYLLTGIPTLVQVLKGYETPIAIRFTNYFDSTWWNCVATYSSDFKDALTKERPAISSLDASTHTTQHRAACVVQATASLNDLWFGGNDGYLEAMNRAFPDLVIEPKIDANVTSCGGDSLCLQAVAQGGQFNPVTMGHVIAQQTFKHGLSDGFNQLGTDAGCTISCRPYSDTSGYTPLKKGSDSWQPLVESNGKGFFYFQEFVTPHIGQKAEFRYLPESERETRVIRKPNYSKKRDMEAREVIHQMALLNDTSKVEIEAFDDKLYIATTIIGTFVNKILGAGQAGFVDTQLGQEGYLLSLERVLHFSQGLTATEYDSIIIAWKEKVRYSLVRPTTVIKELGEERISTWAPGGVQDFAAKDFEAYIRVMPHAEYTSGSSCLFQALEEYIKGYLAALGLDTGFPVEFPPVAKGQSKVEPGIVPASEVVLRYESLEDMAEAGSQSRFKGGMHLRDSVPAGIELCSGIADYVVWGSNNLIKPKGGIFDRAPPSNDLSSSKSSKSSKSKAPLSN